MSRLARRTGLVLGATAAALLLASPATRAYAHLRRRSDPGYPATVPTLFDVNTEANVPTWFSTLLLAAIAAVAAVIAVLSRRSGPPRGAHRRWALLALAFLLMSCDEAVSLHERLGRPVADLVGAGASGWLRHPWVAAGVGLGAVLAGVVAWAVVGLAPAVRRWVAGGLAVYLGGALLLEALSGVVLDATGDGAAYVAVTVAEEGAEVLGAVVLLCSLLAVLDVRNDDRGLRVALAEPGSPARGHRGDRAPSPGRRRGVR